MPYTELGKDLDATLPFTSASVKLIKNYTWSVLCIPVGLSKFYRLTLEVSNDEVTWVPYKLDDAMMDHTAPEIAFDDEIPGDYFRIVYNEDGNTSGTISFQFNNKREA